MQTQTARYESFSTTAAPAKRSKLKAGVVQLAAGTEIQTRKFAGELDGVVSDAPVSVQYRLQVLPAGPLTTPVDGRPPLRHDNVALAAAFNAKGRKAVLDFGHLTEYMPDAEAAGWTVELEVDSVDSALYAWYDLNDCGADAMTDRKFGYTSPTLRIIPMIDETGAEVWQVVGFKSLALTNNPALEMNANFASAEVEDEGEDDIVVSLETPVVPPVVNDAVPAEFTALQETYAAAQTQLTAAQEQVTSLTAQVETLTTSLSAMTVSRDALQTELSTLKADETERAVQAAVQSAFTSKKALKTEATQKFFEASARANLANFQAYLAELPVLPQFSRLPATRSEAGQDETFGLTADELADCARLGIKPETYAKSKPAQNV